MMFFKKINLTIALFFVLVSSAQQFDYLKASTSQGSGTTPNNSTAWTDLANVTIDVTGVSKVLVTASFNMRPDGSSTFNREANYNIYINGSPTVASGIIKREIIKSTATGVQSWGIGSLVHIFDTSALSGNVTFILEHSNLSTGNNRNIYSTSRLSAIALTTAMFGNELSNSVKRSLANFESTSSTYVPVPNLTTDAISLPYQGDIYVATSINSSAVNKETTVEYRLEYTTDDVTWNPLGKEVKRTMINNTDDGIISLVGLLQGQPAGTNYKFRLTTRNFSGTKKFNTYNTNLVAVALSHAGGSHFPSFYTEVGETGVSIVGESTPQQIVTSTNFITGSNIGSAQPDAFVNAQFLVNASNLDSSEQMRAANQMFLDDGTTEQQETEYYRYLPNSTNFGSGVTIGLAENLAENTSYTLSMKHQIDEVYNKVGTTEDEILTTSEVIVTGFQTFDKPISSLGVEEFLASNGLLLYNYKNTIYFKSEKPIEANLKVYSILGQKLMETSIANKRNASIELTGYKGIVLVSIEALNKSYSKKLLIN